MPVLSTKRIPSRQARLGTGGRPPLGEGVGSGSKGSTAFHNALETCRLLMVASVQSSFRLPEYLYSLYEQEPLRVLKSLLSTTWPPRRRRDRPRCRGGRGSRQSGRSLGRGRVTACG